MASQILRIPGKKHKIIGSCQISAKRNTNLDLDLSVPYMVPGPRVSINHPLGFKDGTPTGRCWKLNDSIIDQDLMT